MKVKAIMPVRFMNLVEPLNDLFTDKRTTETAAPVQARSGAVAPLIGDLEPSGPRLRPGDVDSSTHRSTRATTPSRRTSSTATATTSTRTTSVVPWPSADSSACGRPNGAPGFDTLVQAYLDCRQHKRNSASALAFELRLERNLGDLYEQLQAGTYRPGRSICFVVTRPKAREVWAADFRDRIVHHLLYNHIAPRFHAAFVAGSSACIPGRGTLYAAQRLEHDVRSITHNWSRPAHYLKCDLANFFVAIDKAVLQAQLARRVHEPWWMALAELVLMHDPRTDVEVRCPASLLRRVPPHKSLFNAPPGTGLPIGNLSSQFFANVFLDALDQFAKHQVRAQRYVRYVDDFILLHESPQWLHEAHHRIDAWLPANLHAHLNPRKTILQPIDRGIDFVGHVIKPWRRTTRPRTLATALQRLEHMAPADVPAAANSYYGLLRQASHSHTDRRALSRALLRKGFTIDGRLTRVFRKSA